MRKWNFLQFFQIRKFLNEIGYIPGEIVTGNPSVLTRKKKKKSHEKCYQKLKENEENIDGLTNRSSWSAWQETREAPQ